MYNVFHTIGCESRIGFFKIEHYYNDFTIQQLCYNYLLYTSQTHSKI
jgi:hypothetical protein